MLTEIRGPIGFDGLLLTDDISMGALGGALGARCADALAAGCDLVLHCNGAMAEMVEAVAASGPMSAAAIRRAARALSRRGPPGPLDVEGARAELAAST